MAKCDSYKDALYRVKRNFVIIGLTGFTGAGCTECKKILTSDTKPSIPPHDAIYSTIVATNHQSSDLKDQAERHSERNRMIYEKLKKTWTDNDLTWKRFISVEFSVVIFCFAVNKAITVQAPDAFFRAILDMIGDETENFSKINLLWEKNADVHKKESYSEIVRVYESVRDLYEKFKDSASDRLSVTKKMQEFGDQIRRYGSVSPKGKSKTNPDNLFILPEAVRRVLKSYYYEKRSRNDEPYHFVIDTIRNPFEVEYFKWRYSEFYLIGVLRDDKERQAALDITDKNFKELHKKETGGVDKKSSANITEWISSQNIEECLQKADVYVENKRDGSKIFPHLRYNLVKLIALIKKPGCIPPTKDERNMQVAMTAKQMSGCISRQVGAAIVSRDGILVGVGWNDPPSGQTPCSLRSAKDLVDGLGGEIFSEFERSEQFVNHMKASAHDDLPFCFRHEYSVLDAGKRKNEFTRALHAEENAFFQALKLEGNFLQNSTLYTTSKTCTLCAKKAYQLGVSRIVYIEDYTDIAVQQTIMAGTRTVRVDRFQGIIGSAYFKLFAHLIPEKDLIQLFKV